jgi:trans-2,3-dihydro-3-hydroxyanthranilate isomerase
MGNAEMLAVTRGTFLSEAAFVFPRDLSIERELGVSVRIFTPDGEIPFAGHPTLGTAAVLRQLRLESRSANSSPAESLAEISLDLKVGKVPVTFRADGLGWWVKSSYDCAGLVALRYNHGYTSKYEDGNLDPR